MLEHLKSHLDLLGNTEMDNEIGNQQQTLPASDIGWLAGFLDGEGSILLYLHTDGIKLKSANVQVIVGNTEKPLIDNYVRLLQAIPVGVHLNVRHPDRITNGLYVDAGSHKTGRKYKALYVASTVGVKRVKKLLEVVTPYLRSSKQEKAKLIMEYIDIRLSTRNDIFDREKANLVCTICGEAARARSLCVNHYAQWFRKQGEFRGRDDTRSKTGGHTEESLTAMLRVLHMQNSKHTSVIERMLRDCTREQLAHAA